MNQSNIKNSALANSKITFKPIEDNIIQFKPKPKCFFENLANSEFKLNIDDYESCVKALAECSKTHAALTSLHVNLVSFYFSFKNGKNPPIPKSEYLTKDGYLKPEYIRFLDKTDKTATDFLRRKPIAITENNLKNIMGIADILEDIIQILGVPLHELRSICYQAKRRFVHYN